MRVESPSGTWVVPPQSAVWLPPQCVHEARMITDVQLNSLYLEQSAKWTNGVCKFIAISPLLRELIAAVSKEPSAPSGFSRRNAAIAELIIEELDAAPTMCRPIPMPQDPRLRALCQKVLNEPAAHATLDGLTSSVGLSPKTAARLFEKELGMSFRRWREATHAATAVAFFEQGTPVKVVASLLGYTPSAFSVMIRRHSGNTPKGLKGMLATEDFATATIA